MFSLKRFPFFRVFIDRERDGFTLIELVVVMALVGIMLLIAVPNFQHLLTDDARQTSQWILLQVPKFRTRAVSENTIFFLNVDMNARRLWFSNGSMLDEERPSNTASEFQLTDGMRIIDILYANGERIDGGEAFISFYPKGFSDKAILHLEEKNGDRLSFLFEPFLNQVELTEGYVGFED